MITPFCVWRSLRIPPIVPIMRKLQRFSLCLAVVLITAGCTSSSVRDSGFPGDRWDNSPLVMTGYGAVEGKADKAGTWVWRGIPYATPPVGDLRWRAPVPPDDWEGVLKTKKFRGSCTQYSPVLPGIITGSEDCLYLNVWRPQTYESLLPVYVFIHGGGNSVGSANMVPDYYGHNLASTSKMIYVSFNYRLGPFGWFTHPAMRESSDNPPDASGNYGTLDIIAALEWIQENITSFGGDPGRLIVTGESAGGINVTSLLLSEYAKGLFSHAMSQSGGTLLSSVEEGDASSAEVIKRLLISDGIAKDAGEAGVYLENTSAEEIRTYLTGKSGREILKGYSTGTAGMTGAPAIFADGAVIPKAGYELMESGSQPVKVPLILGANKHEVKLFFSFDTSFSWRSDLYQEAGTYGSMRWKANAVDAPARMLSADPEHPPVYAYRFDWGSPDEHGESPLPGKWGLRLGAAHTFEIPFFLGTDTLNGVLYTSRLFTRANRTGRKALSGAMMAYVSRFVRTGNPNRIGDDGAEPVWEPWSNTEGGAKVILFDVNGDEPDIEMSYEEDTAGSILELMRKELDGPLFLETSAYLN